MQVQYAKGMLDMTPADGIGVALAYLIHASASYPDRLRRALSEPIHREGFRGISILEVLKRVCR